MTRYGMTPRLKPGVLEEYQRYPAAGWPQVLDRIRKCNIRNCSIYFKDGCLFSHFEYHGADFRADMDRMAAGPKTQECQAIMEPMQDPFPARQPGEWGAEMEEVFHAD